MIFQHQAAMYFDMARVSATIAIGTGPDPDQRKEISPKTLQEAETRFEQLYFGELVAVEDHSIELAVLSFRDCWQSKGRNCEREKVDQYGQPLKAPVVAELGATTLQDLSLEIAACIRSALQEDRKISFGNIKSAETTCPYD